MHDAEREPGKGLFAEIELVMSFTLHSQQVDIAHRRRRHSFPNLTVDREQPLATIGLAAAIEELRQELYQAQAQGAQQQFAFQIEEAELELLLELRNDGKGEGKLQFGVATVGGGGSHSSVRGHKLTLKLQVKDRAAGGASPEISRRQPGSWDDEG